MKKAAVAALLALVGVVGGSAQAAPIVVHLDGYLVSQTHPGTDDNLAVGSKITLTATYDTRNFIDLGPQFGFGVVFPDQFEIRSGVDSWGKFDDIFDQNRGVHYTESIYQPDGSYSYRSSYAADPTLFISRDKMVGFGGFMVPRSAITPALISYSNAEGDIYVYNDGPGEPVQRVGDVYAGTTSQFTIEERMYYGNQASTPGFTGVWDFANSTVQFAAVPEPATWALMIVGFGGIGFAMRRRVSGPAFA